MQGLVSGFSDEDEILIVAGAPAYLDVGQINSDGHSWFKLDIGCYGVGNVVSIGLIGVLQANQTSDDEGDYALSKILSQPVSEKVSFAFYSRTF
jgi:hypothetical protein